MKGPRYCQTLGHEDRVATHRASWTEYGNARRSRLICIDCAEPGGHSRGVQRGLLIEKLEPSFAGLHVQGGAASSHSHPKGTA